MKKMIAIVLSILMSGVVAFAQLGGHGIQGGSGVSSYSQVVTLWSGGACSAGYLKFNGTCDTPAGTMTYPTGTGITIVSGSAQWGTTISAGTMTAGKFCSYSGTTGLTCNSDSTASMTYPTGTGLTIVTGGTAWGTTIAQGAANTILGVSSQSVLGFFSSLSLDDSNAQIYNSSDNTKKVKIDASNQGSGQTGTIQAPVNGTFTAIAGTALVSGGALGTPSSANLTSATGLPISTGVTGLGSNVATFLGTPSSSNLASAVTDETGSGSLVFGTNSIMTYDTSITTNTGAGNVIAGTSLTIGSAYYMGTSGLAVAKADSSGTSPAVCMAISATQCMVRGIAKITGASWDVGVLYLSSAVSGGVISTKSTTTSHQIQRVGIGLYVDYSKTNVIYWSPSLDQAEVK